MKTKKFGKKLELNKTTITALQGAMMKNAFGGGDPNDTMTAAACGCPPPSAKCETVTCTDCDHGCCCGCGCC